MIPSSSRAARALVLAILLAAPGGGPPPARAAGAAGTDGPDVSGVQALLDDYLTNLARPGAPVDTRFDYERLYDAPDRRERLAAIRAALFAVPPSAMDPRTRLAWAINAYNYLVIETATTNLLIPGKGRTRYTDPREIRVRGVAFFKAKVVELEGRDYSLDEFEVEFTRLGWPTSGRGPMPPGFDPRVHFALVCGARGCPPLLPRVYRADSLDAQLDLATRNALALPRHLRFSNGRLEVSEIFRWYMTDFGGRLGVLDFVRRHAPQETRRALEAEAPKALAGYLAWDWGLNQYPKNLVR